MWSLTLASPLNPPTVPPVLWRPRGNRMRGARRAAAPQPMENKRLFIDSAFLVLVLCRFLAQVSLPTESPLSTKLQRPLYRGSLKGSSQVV